MPRHMPCCTRIRGLGAQVMCLGAQAVCLAPKPCLLPKCLAAQATCLGTQGSRPYIRPTSPTNLILPQLLRIRLQAVTAATTVVCALARSQACLPYCACLAHAPCYQASLPCQHSRYVSLPLICLAFLPWCTHGAKAVPTCHFMLRSSSQGANSNLVYQRRKNFHSNYKKIRG